MADNVNITAGSGTVIATDECTVNAVAVQVPRGKVGFGTDGNYVDVSATNPLPISDSGGSLTVDGTVSVGNFPATQAVSAASLPLPSGAATAARQPSLGTAGTPSVDVLTVQGSASMIAMKVDGSAVTQPVSVAGTLNVASHPVTNVGTFAVQVSSALPTGANVIGAVAQSGTWTVTGAGGSFPVTDSGSSLTVDAPVATPVFVRLSDGTSAIATLAVSAASLPLPTGAAADATLTGGTQKTQVVPATSGGLTPYKLIAAASTNATSLKASAGQLYAYECFNTHATAWRWLKLYDKATAPVVGTDTPVKVIGIPPAGGANLTIPLGVQFSTGIAFAVTTGIADGDTGAVAASEVAINLDYK